MQSMGAGMQPCIRNGANEARALRYTGGARASRTPVQQRLSLHQHQLPLRGTSGLLNSWELREGSTRWRRASGSRPLRCAAPAWRKPRCSNQSAVRVVSSTRRWMPCCAASASALKWRRKEEQASKRSRWVAVHYLKYNSTQCKIVESRVVRSCNVKHTIATRIQPAAQPHRHSVHTHPGTRAASRPCRRRGRRGARRRRTAPPPLRPRRYSPAA